VAAPEGEQLAHELANLLTRVRGFADLARRRLGADHPADADLAQVLAADRPGPSHAGPIDHGA
jgi:hypothetical protein